MQKAGDRSLIRAPLALLSAVLINLGTFFQLRDRISTSQRLNREEHVESDLIRSSLRLELRIWSDSQTEQNILCRVTAVFMRLPGGCSFIRMQLQYQHLRRYRYVTLALKKLTEKEFF